MYGQPQTRGTPPRPSASGSQPSSLAGNGGMGAQLLGMISRPQHESAAAPPAQQLVAPAVPQSAGARLLANVARGVFPGLSAVRPSLPPQPLQPVHPMQGVPIGRMGQAGGNWYGMQQQGRPAGPSFSRGPGPAYGQLPMPMGYARPMVGQPFVQSQQQQVHQQQLQPRGPPQSGPGPGLGQGPYLPVPGYGQPVQAGAGMGTGMGPMGMVGAGSSLLVRQAVMPLQQVQMQQHAGPHQWAGQHMPHGLAVPPTAAWAGHAGVGGTGRGVGHKRPRQEQETMAGLGSISVMEGQMGPHGGRPGTGAAGALARLDYECRPPVRSILTVQRNVGEIAAMYPSLAVPEDLAIVTACWLHTFPVVPHENAVDRDANLPIWPIPVHSTVPIVVDNSRETMEAPADSRDAGEDNGAESGAEVQRIEECEGDERDVLASEVQPNESWAGADAQPLRFYVKVLLLQGVSREACRTSHLLLGSNGPGMSVDGGSGVGLGRYLPAEVRCVIAKRMGSVVLPGGPYDSMIDGGDPFVEDACLLKAGIRHVLQQTGLDLSPCAPSQWSKLLSLQWCRPAPLGDQVRGGQRSMTVVFVLNDLRSAATQYTLAPAVLRTTHPQEIEGGADGEGKAQFQVQGESLTGTRRRHWIVSSADSHGGPAGLADDDEGCPVPPSQPCIRIVDPVHAGHSRAAATPLKHKLYSLSGLLDYNSGDVGEGTCEASLAGEALYESLLRAGARLIVHAIGAAGELATTVVDAQGSGNSGTQAEGLAIGRLQPEDVAAVATEDVTEDDLFGAPDEVDVAVEGEAMAGLGMGTKVDGYVLAPVPVAGKVCAQHAWLQLNGWDVVLAFRLLDRNGTGFVAACDLELLLLHACSGVSQSTVRAIVARALALSGAAGMPLENALAKQGSGRIAYNPLDKVFYPRLLDRAQLQPVGAEAELDHELGPAPVQAPPARGMAKMKIEPCVEDYDVDMADAVEAEHGPSEKSVHALQ